MVGKRKIAALLSVLCLSAVFTGCGGADEKKTIGISQLVQHEALDQAREGFIEGLKEKGYEDGKNITIDYKNANGEVATAQTIAEQFKNDKKDLIFAVATPAAQAAYNTTKDIPIVFTAVTDPVAAEIAKDWKSSGNNCTGTSDGVSVKAQLDFVNKIIPDIKTIGVIFNTSEANSIVQVEALEKEAKERGINVKRIGVTTVNEIQQNLTAAAGDIDLLYTPTDNTVASGYAIVGDVCVKNNIPVLGAEPAVVDKGGLCSLGIDYKQLGKDAAYKAVAILEGKKPSEIEITMTENLSVTINTDVAKKLGITIPQDILDGATKVTGGV